MLPFYAVAEMEPSIKQEKRLSSCTPDRTKSDSSLLLLAACMIALWQCQLMVEQGIVQQHDAVIKVCQPGGTAANTKEYAKK